jgi:predicted dehydrogenase
MPARKNKARRSDTTKPINVALIGYGFGGSTFHAPIIATTNGLRLSFIASSNAAKVKADFPKVEVISYDDACTRPGVDLIVISTPNSTHFSLAQKALTASKHVVVDKPFTTTVVEAEQLIALAQKQNRILSVFQSRRWDADFLTLRKLLATGRLGEVMYLESRYDRFRPEIKKRWKELPGPASGIWYDLGPHLADQALQLFGMPDSIFADFAMQRPGATAVDYFHVLLNYGRKRVILHASSLVVANAPRFFVHGTLGSYVKHGMDTQEAALKSGKRPGGRDSRNGGGSWGKDPLKGMLFLETKGKKGSKEEATVRSVSVPNLPGDYPAYYAALRDAILHGGPNPVPPEQGLQVMSVLELAARSAEQHCEIRL